MKTLKDIVVNEGNDAAKREAIKSLDSTLYTDLRQRFYGVADHMSELTRKLNMTNGETGEFGADLELAKKMLKLFDKMSLGKFV